REKINLLAQGRRAALAEQPRQPEVGTQVLQIRAAHIGETVSYDVFPGAVQEQDASLEVGGRQSAAHGVDNIFGEVLQIQQLFALLFQFEALASQRLGQEARKIRYGEEGEYIGEEPDAQTL